MYGNTRAFDKNVIKSMNINCCGALLVREIYFAGLLKCSQFAFKVYVQILV